jgi:hypothetical protein
MALLARLLTCDQGGVADERAIGRLLIRRPARRGSCRRALSALGTAAAGGEDQQSEQNKQGSAADHREARYRAEARTAIVAS